MNYPNYIVIDAARLNQNLKEVLALSNRSESLFSKNELVTLEYVAPYLCKFEKGGEMHHWFFSEGAKDFAGILIYSVVPFDVLLSHLKKFIIVLDGGKEMYFRFYDPRVLPVFLPTCSIEQIGTFFGPIHFFYSVHSEEQFIQTYYHQNFKLLKKQLAIEEFYKPFNKPQNSIIQSNTGDSSEDEVSTEVKGETLSADRQVNVNSTDKISPRKGKGNKNKWNDFFFE